MKLFIWTRVLTDKSSDDIVIAIGETLSNVFGAWENKANESREGFEEVRTLVNLDQDSLKKGKRRYSVNREYWGTHPSLKVYTLSEAKDVTTYWIKDINLARA